MEKQMMTEKLCKEEQITDTNLGRLQTSYLTMVYIDLEPLNQH